jgi:hypothetical protein
LLAHVGLQSLGCKSGRTWRQLARSLQTVLKLADELYQRGRGSGESVDYSEQASGLEHDMRASSTAKRSIPALAHAAYAFGGPRCLGLFSRASRRRSNTPFLAAANSGKVGCADLIAAQGGKNWLKQCPGMP